jgi:hypothetical protein
MSTFRVLPTRSGIGSRLPTIQRARYSQECRSCAQRPPRSGADVVYDSGRMVVACHYPENSVAPLCLKFDFAHEMLIPYSRMILGQSPFPVTVTNNPFSPSIATPWD